VRQVLKNPVWGKVITRFPPEPSGFLHIGHVKALMLNYHYAKMYNGWMILWFDDTNPSKEKDSFVENIKKDIARLNILPYKVTYTSDYFGPMKYIDEEGKEQSFEGIQAMMFKMIEEDNCYADNLPGDLMKEQRDAGIESPNWSKPIKESLEIFKWMTEGDKRAAGWCIRAKMNM